MRQVIGAFVGLTLLVSGARADQLPEVNTFGLPGLVEMPTAERFDDATLGATVWTSQNQLRTTLSFQIAPRLTGSFRYSILKNYGGPGADLFDRSFDLRYHLRDETAYLPAVAVGLQDFIGTGVYSAEYLVATKHVGRRLALTGGIGWGRLATRGGFNNPLSFLGSQFDHRPGYSGLGGTANTGQWFRGPAAFFGGLRYQVSDKLSLSAEYASDAYTRETSRGMLAQKSPLNFGLQYTVRPGITIDAQYLYGSQLGVSATFSLNPKEPPHQGDTSPGAVPILTRDTVRQMPEGWAADPARSQAVKARLRAAFAQEGLKLQSADLTETTARIRLVNPHFDVVPQALGRAARRMANTLPASVETFMLVPVVDGMQMTAVTVKRADLERFENASDGTRAIYHWADFASTAPDPFGQGNAIVDPRLSWSLDPYVAASLFDPDNPVRADFGIQGRLNYQIAPGLSFTGVSRLKLVGNQNQSTRVSDSVLPHVRSDAYLYNKSSMPTIERATLDYFAKLGPSLYGRLSFGLLEPMFGGLSSEVLWKPDGSRFALGADLNYVRQRGYDQDFSFLDYQVATGHVSAYYAFPNGFDVAVDLGRYLAGDWGATLSVDRTFNNGWKIGAYATFTNVSFSDFGEGSFDKGIRFTIPLSWFTGRPSRSTASGTIRPIVRDGGARLSVANRLYGEIRDYQNPALTDQWGKFWR